MTGSFQIVQQFFTGRTSMQTCVIWHVNSNGGSRNSIPCGAKIVLADAIPSQEHATAPSQPKMLGSIT